jgi:hypothetical protein
LAEIEYDPQDEGWFPVSRRFTNSSRWIRSTPQAIKIMVYLLEKASNPMNPHIGDILETVPVIAAGTKLSEQEVTEAISDLCGPDECSQGQALNGAFLETLTRGGNVVGWRVVNFDLYNPGVRERSEKRKAEKRVAKAKNAASIRWEKAKSAAKELEDGDIPVYGGKQ